MSQAPRRRIAVVDDDAFMVRIMTMMIGRVGDHAVDGFEDARAACAAITAPDAGYDVVILDLNMPDMDGFTFFRKLGEARCPCALILFSGEADHLLVRAEELARAQGLRVVGHLPKPPQFDALSQLLHSAQEERLVGTAISPEFGPAELLDAIASGEIACLYQPTVDLASTELVGMHASVRWAHPTEGALEPDAFMGLAHRAGMSGLLTREVLDMAMAQQARWRAEGLELPVSVPAAGPALTEADFPDFASACAARHGVDPRAVVLRLRESELAQADTAVAEVVARLHLRRFRIAIDDFGSSGLPMRMLGDLNIDEIRVASALLERARAGGTGERVLQACADVALRLRARAIAAGLDSDADWTLGRRCGFDLGEGTFIAAPLAGAEVAAWRQAWERRAWADQLRPR